MNAKDRGRLVRAHLKVAKAMDELASAKIALNEQIVELTAGGATVRDISSALGVSPSRAWQMIRQADGRGRSDR